MALGGKIVITLTFQFTKSILGFPFSKLIFGGMRPRSKVKIPLIKPAMPAAPSRWPIFVFTEPTSIGLLAERTEAIVLEMAWSS